jgi:hypothetical protein
MVQRHVIRDHAFLKKELQGALAGLLAKDDHEVGLL